MTTRYRNDYISKMAQLGTLPKTYNTTLMNRTTEESRARFGSILNSLDTNEEKLVAPPPTPVIREYIREEPFRPPQAEPVSSPVGEPVRVPERKQTSEIIGVVVVIILIVIMLIVIFKLYQAQKRIDTLITEEIGSHRFVM